jgi:hypothetical protein
MAPPPPQSTALHFLPPLPIPPPSPVDEHTPHHHNHFSNHSQNSHSHSSHRPQQQHYEKQQQQQQQPQRHMYPTSSPSHRLDISPDPSLPSATRLPPITASFTSGYASPASSSHSSEQSSRDELDIVMGDPNAPSGMSSNMSGHNNNNFHGQHVSLPGVDGMLSRGNGMLLDSTPSPRHKNRDWETPRRWNMRDFVLIQTVGRLPFFALTDHGADDLLPYRHGDLWTSLSCSLLDSSSQ